MHTLAKHRHARFWPSKKNLTPRATVGPRRLKPKGLRVRGNTRDMWTRPSSLDAVARPPEDDGPPKVTRLKARPCVVHKANTEP